MRLGDARWQDAPGRDENTSGVPTRAGDPQWAEDGPEEYEGLHCFVCGAESDNTDLCVPCALRAVKRDYAEQSAGYADDEAEF